MTFLPRFIPMLLAILALPGAAETALDIYEANLKEAEHSAQAQLLLSLTLQDCRSLSDIDGQDRFETMVEEVSAMGIADFSQWEADVRKRWAWCEDLLEKFGGDDYGALEKAWLAKSVASGSSLGALIEFNDRLNQRSFQQSLTDFGADVDVIERPVLDDFTSHLRRALADSFESGDARLKRAALFQVHLKFRKDELSAISESDSGSRTLTPQDEHELGALRSGNQEMPWNFLTCKYSRSCTTAAFAAAIGDYFSQSQIQSFRETAEYYERCIEAGDWVSLGLIE